ncbi:MAG: CHAP domain-containing protein [Ruminococcus sp.]|nr:CHAP domain-containing protein [Ruminococcus sp.]
MIKRLVSIITVTAVMIAGIFSSSFSAFAEDNYRFSDEYKTSPYYQNLMTALENTQDSTVMERTLAVALSQEGYANFATEGYNLDQARAEGKLWTGTELRMNDNLTGNTEYTRWAQRYLMNRDEESQYADYDWCAIFVSWCLYQAGYYTDEALKRYFYSYDADPRIFYDADSWIMSYNLDQHKVWYVPKAHHKLDAMDWNTYYNVDVDPYDIPYRPGGLVFFSWDTSGKYFNHVAIVVDYDEESHILTYSNGNSDGVVITRQIDLDTVEEFRGQTLAQNSERIMAYAEYDKFEPMEQREITCDQTEIFWDKGADIGLRIQTDSESILASVYIDDNYHGSIIESNMIFHEGLLSIGKSEIVNLAAGHHKLKLVFEDGELELKLIITDAENMKIGDADLDGTVSVLDATTIQKHLASIKYLAPPQRTPADADKDGSVTILDATIIQKHLAGLVEQL